MKKDISNFDFYRIKKIFEKTDFSVGREQSVWKRILQKKEDMPNQSYEECMLDEELQSVAGGMSAKNKKLDPMCGEPGMKC